MISLGTVLTRDRELLWSVFQKYMYEMSWLYLDEMDDSGNYPYEHFDDYFCDPRRFAYFIYDDDTLIGFAMLCPYSCTDTEPDHTMAEFTIFPAFRQKHFAKEAVDLILSKHPGKWEIKYSERNPAAKKLWNSIAKPYDPEIVHLDDDETALVFNC